MLGRVHAAPLALVGAGGPFSFGNGIAYPAQYGVSGREVVTGDKMQMHSVNEKAGTVCQNIELLKLIWK